MNVFTQDLAGRTRFGIATALMQSTRMVGGMMGTAAVGTLVAHRYASGVAHVLALAVTHGSPDAWLGRVTDPQVLVDMAAQQALLADLQRAGIDGRPVIDASREVLVSAINDGLLMTAVGVLAALLLVRRIADVRLHRPPPHEAKQAATSAPH
jgi:hypothetical protein